MATSNDTTNGTSNDRRDRNTPPVLTTTCKELQIMADKHTTKMDERAERLLIYWNQLGEDDQERLIDFLIYLKRVPAASSFLMEAAERGHSDWRSVASYIDKRLGGAG